MHEIFTFVLQIALEPVRLEGWRFQQSGLVTQVLSLLEQKWFEILAPGGASEHGSFVLQIPQEPDHLERWRLRQSCRVAQGLSLLKPRDLRFKKLITLELLNNIA